MAPGNGFFGKQRLVIWIFNSINLHVALSVVCGYMVFAVYIPYNNLITMNIMFLQYIFNDVISWYLLIIFVCPLGIFFYKPDCNNLKGNV